MKNKISFLIGTCFIIIFLLTGCAKTIPFSDTQLMDKVVQAEDVQDTCDRIPTIENVAPKPSEVTPYQLLNLMVGNAEEISFDYTLQLHETGEREIGSIFKSGEKYAAVFTTKDMNGNSITVREVEADGRVLYILDENKKIANYLAPAEDFLLYEMMKAAANVSTKAFSKDGLYIYEYQLPFDQDEAIIFTYRFFMKDNTLLKLEYLVDDLLSKTYEFSVFLQEVTAENVFEYPLEGYREECFDYHYTGEHLPPWWELDGLGDT